jgi:hypothetical protein
VIQYGLLDASALAGTPAFRVVYEGGICIRPHFILPEYATAHMDETCAPNTRSAVLLSADGRLIGTYSGGDLEAEPTPSP